MDFVIGLLFSPDEKKNSYNIIFVIINQHTKIVSYIPVKTIIGAVGLAKNIIKMVVRHYGLSKSIVSDRG